MNPPLKDIAEPAVGSVLVESSGHVWYRDPDEYWYCFCEPLTSWDWSEVVEDTGPDKTDYEIEGGDNDPNLRSE